MLAVQRMFFRNEVRPVAVLKRCHGTRDQSVVRQAFYACLVRELDRQPGERRGQICQSGTGKNASGGSEGIRSDNVCPCSDVLLVNLQHAVRMSDERTCRPERE